MKIIEELILTLELLSTSGIRAYGYVYYTEIDLMFEVQMD